MLTPIASLKRELAFLSPRLRCADDTLFDIAHVERVIREGLADVLESAVAGASEPDRGLYWYRVEATAVGRLRVVLGEERPQVVSVSLDGKSRPAYRLGGCRGSRGFQWADWPAGVDGADPGGSTTPVYVQAHALDRLRERVPVPPADLHLSLLASLADPVVAGRDGDDAFVKSVLYEFHVDHYSPVKPGPPTRITCHTVPPPICRHLVAERMRRTVARPTWP